MDLIRDDSIQRVRHDTFLDYDIALKHTLLFSESLDYYDIEYKTSYKIVPANSTLYVVIGIEMVVNTNDDVLYGTFKDGIFHYNTILDGFSVLTGNLLFPFGDTTELEPHETTYRVLSDPFRFIHYPGTGFTQLYYDNKTYALTNFQCIRKYIGNFNVLRSLKERNLLIFE